MQQTHCKPLKNDFSKKNPHEKLRFDERTEYGGTLKNFRNEKNSDVCSTMSETKAAFAERDFQSLTFIILGYIENHAEKIVPKLRQFFFCH